MLDVHPLHGRIQGWKDFFMHIATIVVGLLIAVALEQTVEYFHHRHQVAEFEARMHEELESDAKLLDEDIRRQDAYRSYLVEIQTAIKAKLANQAYKMPPEEDARNHWGYYVPLLIPYRIAQQNGTLAHLDVDRLELYSRLELQQELIWEIIHRYTAALDAARALRLNFNVESESLTPDRAFIYANPDELSPSDLIEFRRVNAAVISQIDAGRQRFVYMRLMVRCVLNGVKQDGLNDCVRGHASMNGAPDLRDARY